MSLLTLISHCLVFNVRVLRPNSGLYSLEVAVHYVTEYCKMVRDDCHSKAPGWFCFLRQNVCQANRFTNIMRFIGTNFVWRSRVRVPIVSLKFFIDIILLVALWPGVGSASNRNECREYLKTRLYISQTQPFIMLLHSLGRHVSTHF